MHMLVVVPINRVSTHSRAEAAAFFFRCSFFSATVSTHSRAEAAAPDGTVLLFNIHVSTHSRAEAAAVEVIAPTKRDYRFNTQPRGGGCLHRVF